MGNAQSYGEFEKWDIFKLYPGNLKKFLFWKKCLQLFEKIRKKSENSIFSKMDDFLIKKVARHSNLKRDHLGMLTGK